MSVDIFASAVDDLVEDPECGTQAAEAVDAQVAGALLTFPGQGTLAIHRAVTEAASRATVTKQLYALVQLQPPAFSAATEATEMCRQAETWEVVDADTCLAGERMFDRMRRLEQDAHTDYDEEAGILHATWKRWTDARGLWTNRIEALRKQLGERIASWKLAQLQREEQAQRARELAAREEDLRVAKAEAAVLVAQGQVAAATTVLQEAAHAPLPVLPKPQSQVAKSGTSSLRQPYVATIEDWPLLRTAIGCGDYPEFDTAIQEAILPLLQAQAKTLKTELGKRYVGVVGRIKPSLAGR